MELYKGPFMVISLRVLKSHHKNYLMALPLWRWIRKRLSCEASHRGHHTCEVTELSTEGETIIELKYCIVSWFSPNENILIVIFPILAVLLSWGQCGIVTLKYKSSLTKEETILLFVGLVLTKVVILSQVYIQQGMLVELVYCNSYSDINITVCLW